MSLLANSLNTSKSHNTVSSRSFLFCCFSPSAEPSDENQKVEKIEEEKITENGMVSSDLEKSLRNSVKGEDYYENADSSATMIEKEESKINAEQVDNLSDCEADVVGVVGQNVREKSKTSELQVKIGIYSDKTALTLTVVDAFDIARPGVSTNSIRKQGTVNPSPVLAYSVHILVLPLKKLRFKTMMRTGPDPYFDEIIKIPKINLEEVKTWSLRLRLYGIMRNSSKEILGEGFLFLDWLEPEMRTQCKLSLLNPDPNVPENIVNTMISTSKCNYESLISLDHPDRQTISPEGEAVPELLIGLSYNFTIGRLTIEIIKGNKFPKLKDGKPPDTQINIAIRAKNGDEIAHMKTALKKGTSEPRFEENFIFKMLSSQFQEITLTISGNYKTQGKLTGFGSFVMGSTCSTEVERIHWKDLISSNCGDQNLCWHSFQISA